MIVLMIVTVTSILLAAIMSAIAWRVSGDEKRRSESRIAALAAEIFDEPVRRVQQDPACNSVGTVGRVRSDPPMFTPRSGSRSRALAIAGGGALVFGAAVALAIVVPGAFRRPAPAARAAAATSAPAAQPLELVALGHERVGDQLTVRGVVRNPPSGTGVDGLTAVVLLFTPDGELLTTGRAMLDAPALQPGRESAFVVTVPRALDAGRYRVSFRADDHVVPHRDRRHES